MTTNRSYAQADLNSVIEGHELRNEALRQNLISKGADLGEPRMIECHFWSWSQGDAAALAADLESRGFQILKQEPARSSKDPDLWNVEATIKQSIDLTLRREFTDELIRMAASHSGKYDGWGTRL
jgi:regulator of RNase E activity RraB